MTLDLSEPAALDMVKGGNVVALVADKAYELGQTMAATGLKALLGQETPAFIVAPALTVTKADVSEGWRQSLNRDRLSRFSTPRNIRCAGLCEQPPGAHQPEILEE